MPIEYSEDVEGRNVKVLHWGEAKSGKTEGILRNYPDVLLIDIEGNSDHCIDVEGIPPFIRLVSKNIYEILAVIDQVAAGEITFPDGRPVQTIALDGLSVLWSVRQEVGDLAAKERARRRNRDFDPEKSNLVQLDWVKIKKPLKKLYAKMNIPGVKYFVVTARSKDLYEEDAQGNLKKTGFTTDAMRGLDYEVNLILQFFSPTNILVNGGHGKLSELFPEGQTLNAYPAQQILSYAKGGGTAVTDDTTAAEEQLLREGRDKPALVRYGRTKGLEAADVAEALNAAGLSFDPDNWDEMTTAIDEYVSGEDEDIAEE
jgi:hypothetical protein